MQKIRNVAIIAHVDHGKTTLVDRILHQVSLFRENQDMGELILDSNDLERERGITILAKNISVRYQGFKINIIDTPGHADFGGEVERVLNMADGVLLLVDAFEGPMPQTRFVLEKALQMNKKPVVVVNKVDKPNCDPERTQEMVFDLMFSLGANEWQLDFPTVFGSAKNGWMAAHWKKESDNVTYLLDTIIESVPPPQAEEGTLQMMITSLDYSSYTGRIAVGRIVRGVLKQGMPVSIVKRDGKVVHSRVKELFVFEGLGKERVKIPVPAGDICAVLLQEDFEIGDTIADIENPEALPAISVDEPTMSMLFTINNSPFFGKDGKFVTSRHLRERLFLEIEKNLALRVEETDSPEIYIVYGRGILHLSVLVENMRREGYEMQVGQPRVIIKEIEGVKCEPMEELNINVPSDFSGKVIELVTSRKGELVRMDNRDDRSYMIFKIASRALIGLQNNLMTATEGEAVMSHRFTGFEPWKGDILARRNGSLIAMETGTAIAFSLNRLKDRGCFFIEPNDPIYAGQIIGQNSRHDDLEVNVIHTKKLTNMRASGSDEKMVLPPAVKFSLEECMEYIAADEYLEITPKSLRIRKIILNETERKRKARK